MTFTAEQLREIFELRDGGVLVWRKPSKFHKNVIGTVAGGIQRTHNGKNYRLVNIGGRKYRNSHLVYCMTTGKWPENQIDHRDGNSLNDDPSNLRPATVMQNAWNHKGRRKRSALPMGVKLLANGRYQARIAVSHKCMSLGTYETPEAASAVYQSARKQYFGEFA